MNAQQLEVVRHRGSPLLVFAAAGTGKTQALTARIADLVLRDGVPPDRILALTFTRKAAGEMRARAAAQVGGDARELCNVGTFHSLCLRWLRAFADAPDAGCPLSRDFTVLEPHDARALMQECVPAPGAAAADASPSSSGAPDHRKRGEEVARVVEGWRNQGLHPEDVRRIFEAGEQAASALARSSSDTTASKNVRRDTTRDALLTYEAYRAACARQDVSDFNDLLLHVTSALERSPRLQALCQARLYAHLLVDEFQDTNPCQMKLVELLCERSAKVDAFVDNDNVEDDGKDDKDEGYIHMDDSDSADSISDRGADDVDPSERQERYGVRRGGRLSEDRLMVVGDDYQAIHGWRGAAVRNITCFADSFPRARTLHLETNYRSLPRILEAAGTLIAHNPEQHHKRLDAARRSGDASSASPPSAPASCSPPPLIVRPCADAWGEASLIVSVIRRRGIRPGDAAVLYRTHAQSQPVEEAFRKAGVPYVIKGTLSFFCRAEIKDCLAFARFLVNPRSNADMVRILLGSGAPGHGIGKATVDRLASAAKHLGGAPPVSLWEAATTLAPSCSANDENEKNEKNVVVVGKKKKQPPLLSLSSLGRSARSVARFVETMRAFIVVASTGEGEGEGSDAGSRPAAGVLRDVLEATGYLKQLRDATARDPVSGEASDARARLDNVTTFLELAERLGGGGSGLSEEDTEDDTRRPQQQQQQDSSRGGRRRPPTLREFVDACAMEEEEEEEEEEEAEEEAEEEENSNEGKEQKNKKKKGKVVLTTLHASKGLEFPAVFMVGACEDLLPYYAARNDAASVAEERRLCYVGFTRARDLLVVTHPRERQLFGNRVSCRRSRFLAEAAVASPSSSSSS